MYRRGLYRETLRHGIHSFRESTCLVTVNAIVLVSSHSDLLRVIASPTVMALA